MTANSVPDDLEAQVRELRAQVRELQRPRSGSPLNKRDLRDCRALTKIADGQTDVYDAALGTWVPGEVGGAGGPPPFTLPGGVALSTSGRWYPPETETYTRLFASQTNAGSSSTTTVALLRNGVSVTTVSLVATDLAQGVDFSQAFTGPETDYMQVQVTAAGTGAANLVVQVS